jgi:hypothetical protein
MVVEQGALSVEEQEQLLTEGEQVAWEVSSQAVYNKGFGYWIR